MLANSSKGRFLRRFAKYYNLRENYEIFCHYFSHINF